MFNQHNLTYTGRNMVVVMDENSWIQDNSIKKLWRLGMCMYCEWK